MSLIFKENGLIVFDPTYIPEKIPHRESQFNTIIESLENGIKYNVFSIPIIYGFSGTGKTTVVKKALIYLKEKYSREILTCYINAATTSKSYIAIQKMIENVTPVPYRGLSADEMIHKLYEVLDIRNVKYIVAIDDADELIRRERGKIIDILSRIEEMYGRRLIYPVFILRDISVINGLAPYIRSKLGGPKIKFEPYNKTELIDISMERIQKGFKDNAISNNAIDACAYAVEKYFYGNARELINLLYKAGKIAEYLGHSRITTEIIRHALYDSFTKFQKFYYGENNINELKVLWILSKLLSKNIDKYKIFIRKNSKDLEAIKNIYKDIFKEEISEDSIIDIFNTITKREDSIICRDGDAFVLLASPAKVLSEKLSVILMRSTYY